MKQEKTGDNIRNQRRNGVSQTYRRYLQRRHADPEIRNLGRGVGCVVKANDYWDEVDPTDRARNLQDWGG